MPYTSLLKTWAILHDHTHSPTLVSTSYRCKTHNFIKFNATSLMHVNTQDKLISYYGLNKYPFVASLLEMARFQKLTVNHQSSFLFNPIWGNLILSKMLVALFKNKCANYIHAMPIWVRPWDWWDVRNLWEKKVKFCLKFTAKLIKKYVTCFYFLSGCILMQRWWVCNPRNQKMLA